MRILVVEDHKDILANISEYFTLKGYEVVGALDGLTGLHLATTGNFDAIILDLMLPGMDGNLICKKLREDSRDYVPVLMLTARDQLEDRLTGFYVGADDYIIKPFALSELVARVEAITSRPKGVRKNVLKVHDLTYDLDCLEVHRAGTLLKLNPTGLVLLELLMRKSPVVVKRKELEQVVWGSNTPDSDSLRTNIYMLRKIIDKPFDIPLLHTAHNVGYKLQGPR
ncbi:XRE family transcriptional regulator [Pseudomonas taetrolens]|uniref:XRE family transcriptional regulator n=1 Tax=Pseudomonas taetrolens TaxID=47884 RepID=A0A0J6JHX6_PSETA|nr:response regulator transcription factor [Pseudomonas taetrolens]KMM83347.1 XRE family transcriptional regulator [Pseudomonas taetrolens]VEH50178.1 two component transcriptional regulator [Pseudomonas taetrolens]